MKPTEARNNPLATNISKCHSQKYYSVLTYVMLLIKNSNRIKSYKLLTRLNQIFFSIINWHEAEREKKNQKNYAAERRRQSSLAGAVYTHSISEQIFFFFKEREIWGFLIIYLKNYIHVLKM